MGTYCGIGVTGESDNLRGLIALASPGITTKEQYTVAKGLDPLDDTFEAVMFVDKIGPISTATEGFLYIDKNGVAAYQADEADTEYTLINGSFVDPMYDPRLKSLAIGALTLSPTFASDKTEYTASTTGATQAVTVVTSSATATAVIKNGETTVSNGGNASLSDGENTIAVTVVDGPFKRVYTAVVTKT